MSLRLCGQLVDGLLPRVVPPDASAAPAAGSRRLAAIGPIRMASRIPFTAAEEQRVLAALATFPKRDRCLVIVGLNTGYRVSELSAVTIGDVWDGTEVRPEITIARRFLKGGRGVHRSTVRSRTIPLNSSAREAIRSYVAERRADPQHTDFHAPLFLSQRGGRGLRRWQINRVVHRAAAAAGIGRQDRIGNHTLRQSFCRKIFEACGRDINATRALMGHRYVTTTQAYLEIDAERLRSAVLSIG